MLFEIKAMSLFDATDNRHPFTESLTGSFARPLSGHVPTRGSRKLLSGFGLGASSLDGELPAHCTPRTQYAS
jgi:hypothetical protein